MRLLFAYLAYRRAPAPTSLGITHGVNIYKVAVGGGLLGGNNNGAEPEMGGAR